MVIFYSYVSLPEGKHCLHTMLSEDWTDWSVWKDQEVERIPTFDGWITIFVTSNPPFPGQLYIVFNW